MQVSTFVQYVFQNILVSFRYALNKSEFLTI